MKKVFASGSAGTLEESAIPDNLKFVNEIAEKYAGSFFSQGKEAFKNGLDEMVRKLGKNLRIGHVELYTYLFNTWVFKKAAAKAGTYAGVFFRPVGFSEAVDMLSDIITTLRKNGLKLIKKMLSNKKDKKSAELAKAAAELFEFEIIDELEEKIKNYIKAIYAKYNNDPHVIAALYHHVYKKPFAENTKQIIMKTLQEVSGLTPREIELIPYSNNYLAFYNKGLSTEINNLVRMCLDYERALFYINFEEPNFIRSTLTSRR